MKEFTHQEMLDMMPVAKTYMADAQIALMDIKEEKGFIQFADIQTVVEMFAVLTTPLAKALTNLLECENVVTVLASEYVSVR